MLHFRNFIGSIPLLVFSLVLCAQYMWHENLYFMFKSLRTWDGRLLNGVAFGIHSIYLDITIQMFIQLCRVFGGIFYRGQDNIKYRFAPLINMFYISAKNLTIVKMWNPFESAWVHSRHLTNICQQFTPGK